MKPAAASVSKPSDEMTNMDEDNPKNKTNERARHKFRWLNQIARDPSVSDATFRLAFLLSNFFSREDGTAWPSQETLARLLGKSIRAVRTASDALAVFGYLAIEVSRGRGRSNRYRPILKNRLETSGFECGKAEEDFRFSDQKTGSPAHEKRKNSDKKTGRILPTNSINRTYERTYSLRESDHRNEFSDNKMPAKKEGLSKVSHLAKQKQIEAGFAEFWSVWPRKVARADAERAYGRAVKAGADPAAVLEGARRYAAEVVGREEKFIAHASTWLNGRRWLDPPTRAAGTVIDEMGNPVALPAVAMPTTPARSDSFTAIAARMAAQRRSAGGGQ